MGSKIGVVDTNLIVYGTRNLRIADASIMPIPIAAHLQTTAYAIGEKVCSDIFVYFETASKDDVGG